MNTVKINADSVKFIAHRGLSGIETENTYPAFVAAANRCYYGIEADLRKTADGKFVIIHDKITDRISRGRASLNIKATSYATLSGIVLPDADGTFTRQDIRIPLLEDYIKICKKYNKKCLLELKDTFERADIIRVIDIISKSEYLENVIFISFSEENCTALRKLLSESDIQLLLKRPLSDKTIKILTENRFGAAIAYILLTEDVVYKLKKHKIKINCWTCDSKKDAERLIEMGVDFITTNILEPVCK